MLFKSPIGISDFAKLRKLGCYYVDKTRLITDLLADPAEVLLFPRPRRFGKTLNLWTLRYFLEKTDEDRAWMFEGLDVWRSEEARKHYQRYPVVFLTFKDVKARDWESCARAIALELRGLHAQHRYLLEAGALAPEDSRAFEQVLNGEALQEDLWKSLSLLSSHLARYHGEKVVILIDEYDTPIHAGHTHGYFDDVTLFFRNFLGGGLKDNPHLFKGVLTGILRVAKESMFSGLNNVRVHSVLSPRYATAFGFTQAEVDALAKDVGKPDVGDEMERWYNGYRFAGHVIYNPWSVLCFADSPEQGPRPYWVQTASDDVLRGLVLEQGHSVAYDFERLLSGEAVTKVIDESIVMRDVGRDDRAVWSLLLMSGYVTAREPRMEAGKLLAGLVIPNEEVRHVFEQSVVSWVHAGLGGGDNVRSLLDAVLGGDAEVMQEALSQLVLATFSVHDTADRSGAGDAPERVYQAFLLGMLVKLAPRYQVKSNAESGFGRYDVAVLPKQAGQPGVVMELKRLRRVPPETVEQALESALRQIEQRRYTTELEARGASPIHTYGIVFDGKRVWVRKG